MDAPAATGEANEELRLVVFFVELPDALPVADGSTLAFYTEEHMDELEDLVFKPLRSLTSVPGPGTNNVFVSFRFWQVAESDLESRHPWEATDFVLKKIMPDNLKPRREADFEPPAGVGYRTVVEAVTPLVRCQDADAMTERLSDAFDRCERRGRSCRSGAQSRSIPRSPSLRGYEAGPRHSRARPQCSRPTVVAAAPSATAATVASSPALR